MFDDSIDLVIWGHEHEQLLTPEVVADKGYRISQPGSSVATSLSQSETVEKQVGLLSIHGRTYKMEPLTLKTVRPFVMDDIDLSEEADEGNVDLKKRESIQKLLREKVNELIDRANAQWQEAQDLLPEEERLEKRPLPLVRLKVVYAPNDLGNPIRFGQEFSGKIANPKDVLAYTKKKVVRKAGEFSKNERTKFYESCSDSLVLRSSYFPVLFQLKKTEISTSTKLSTMIWFQKRRWQS